MLMAAEAFRRGGGGNVDMEGTDVVTGELRARGPQMFVLPVFVMGSEAVNTFESYPGRETERYAVEVRWLRFVIC